MQKIKIIVDSPSDIPSRYLERYDIAMVGVPIVVDGREYIERESFSIRESYSILDGAKELPKTSRVPIGIFAGAYQNAWLEGFTDIIVITINAGGSGIYESAQMAAEVFFSDCPKADGTFSIHLIDSMSYSMGYGYPVTQAAIMAQKGQPVDEILDYLYDWFSRVEISLACYTLDYAKKSGRITAAAAFVGDVLGMRPIISMIDGTTRVTEKVRGDKNVVPRLIEVYHKRRVSADDPVLVVSGSVDEYGEQLKTQLEEELGRKIPHYKVGTAVAINSGPRMAALVLLGERRERNGDGSRIGAALHATRRTV